jgi:hypothetical protein
MINEATLNTLVVHYVGNRINDEKLTISKSPVNVEDETLALLSASFIGTFKTEKYYNFHHPSDLELNDVFKAAAAVFDAPETLRDVSETLAERLYDIVESPKTKGGEVYVAYFGECLLDGEPMDALGIFKSETRETYLKIYPASGNFILEKEEGVNLRKTDKGCIIFNTEKEKGYLVAVADGLKSGDEKYWTGDFLSLKPHDNAYTKTQNMMKTCKEFLKDRMPEEFEVNGADQIDMLNRSINYFKSHDTFDKPEFEREVLKQPEIIESFREFDQNSETPLDLTFDIEPQAVKKNAGIFKSVLKLDKNFHIYIHGDRSKIERGEEDGKKFYRIFFETEN